MSGKVMCLQCKHVWMTDCDIGAVLHESCPECGMSAEAYYEKNPPKLPEESQPDPPIEHQPPFAAPKAEPPPEPLEAEKLTSPSPGEHIPPHVVKFMEEWAAAGYPPIMGNVRLIVDAELERLNDERDAIDVKIVELTKSKET